MIFLSFGLRFRLFFFFLLHIIRIAAAAFFVVAAAVTNSYQCNSFSVMGNRNCNLFIRICIHLPIFVKKIPIFRVGNEANKNQNNRMNENEKKCAHKCQNAKSKYGKYEDQIREQK